MPTTTFFNLPAEKRNKFLRAARGEFARVPITDVSINRIIQAAGIPRGSFYMYFKDKRELLFFLLGEYNCRLFELMETALLEEDGDLLSAFLTFYDAVRRTYSEPCQADAFRSLVSILRLNAGLHSEVFQTAAQTEALLERFIPHIDKSLLDLRSESDLKDMFTLLLGVTGSALCNTLQTSNPPVDRARYVSFLDILGRGMTAHVTSH